MYSNVNMCNNINKEESQGGYIYHLMCSVEVVFIQFSNLVLRTQVTIAQLPYYMVVTSW